VGGCVGECLSVTLPIWATNAFEDLKAELAKISETHRHSAIVLEKELDQTLTRYCKDNRITIEVFLEAAWIQASSNPDAMAEILAEAKRCYGDRKQAGKLRRLITMIEGQSWANVFLELTVPISPEDPTPDNPLIEQPGIVGAVDTYTTALRAVVDLMEAACRATARSVNAIMTTTLLGNRATYCWTGTAGRKSGGIWQTNYRAIGARLERSLWARVSEK
jgi:hypothetical protein